MPLKLHHISLDDYYLSTERKIVLNKYSHIDIDVEQIESMIYTVYEDEISLVPKCECEYLKGSWRIGKVCPKCGTTVASGFDNIKPLLWIEKFRDDLPFLNPHFWGQLKNLFASNRIKIDAIRWLTDTSYNPPKIPPVLYPIAEFMGGRGYKNFITKLDDIMVYIKNMPQFKLANKVDKVEELIELYNKEKDILFSDHIPMINKRLFVMEKTAKGTFTLPMLADIKDLIYFSIRLANLDPNSKKVENGTAKIISSISALFDTYMSQKMAKKKRLVRRHIYGTRSHFTFRGVIVSLPTTTNYNEIHVPWQVGPTAFRPHVMSKLVHEYGYTVKEASKLLFEAATKYHPLIDEILQKLIEETVESYPEIIGIPVLFHRFPSLLQGSSQLLYITKFKTDIEDRTIGCNMLIIKAPNGD